MALVPHQDVSIECHEENRKAKYNRSNNVKANQPGTLNAFFFRSLTTIGGIWFLNYIT